jgi:hypothetical protein
MREEMRAEEAAQALAGIRERQEQVINVAVPPARFWWLLATLTVAFAAAVESRRPLVIGVGTALFVAGVLASLAWALRRAMRVQVRNELLGWRGGMLIAGFALLTAGGSIAVGFSLSAAGVPHPATLGNLFGAILLVAGGPLLMRALRRIMLDRSGAAQ